MHLELFPQQYIDLNEEVQRHPDLLEILAKEPSRDLTVMLAAIATFCNVIVDGSYTHQDLLILAEGLRKKLYERRTGLVVVSTQAH